jgi:hypothetical protein
MSAPPAGPESGALAAAKRRCTGRSKKAAPPPPPTPAQLFAQEPWTRKQAVRVRNWRGFARRMACVALVELDATLTHQALKVLFRDWRPNAAQLHYALKPPGCLLLDLNKLDVWLQRAELRISKARGAAGRAAGGAQPAHAPRPVPDADILLCAYAPCA